MYHGFNPRTRVGCDFCYRLLPEYAAVSIHAPAWGATLSPSSVTDVTQCFNPRTRVGCDPRRDGLPVYGRYVSIHAPAWGATVIARLILQANEFQSTHPRGVRLLISSLVRLEALVSIHAPAWGATGGGRLAGRPPPSFNPRTRVGCDTRLVRPPVRGVLVSIHAPAWGATPAGETPAGCKKSFNPRTRVGCDTI